MAENITTNTENKENVFECSDLENYLDEPRVKEKSIVKNSVFECDELEAFLNESTALDVTIQVPHLLAESGIRLTREFIASEPTTSLQETKPVPCQLVKKQRLSKKKSLSPSLVKQPNVKPRLTELPLFKKNKELRKNRGPLRTKAFLRHYGLKLVGLVIYPGPCEALPNVVRHHLETLRRRTTHISSRWANFATSAVVTRKELKSANLSRRRMVLPTLCPVVTSFRRCCVLLKRLNVPNDASDSSYSCKTHTWTLPRSKTVPEKQPQPVPESELEPTPHPERAPPLTYLSGSWENFCRDHPYSLRSLTDQTPYTNYLFSTLPSLGYLEVKMKSQSIMEIHVLGANIRLAKNAVSTVLNSLMRSRFFFYPETFKLQWTLTSYKPTLPPFNSRIVPKTCMICRNGVFHLIKERRMLHLCMVPKIKVMQAIEASPIFMLRRLRDVLDDESKEWDTLAILHKATETIKRLENENSRLTLRLQWLSLTVARRRASAEKACLKIMQEYPWNRVCNTNINKIVSEPDEAIKCLPITSKDNCIVQMSS